MQRPLRLRFVWRERGHRGVSLFPGIYFLCPYVRVECHFAGNEIATWPIRKALAGGKWIPDDLPNLMPVLGSPGVSCLAFPRWRCILGVEFMNGTRPKARHSWKVLELILMAAFYARSYRTSAASPSQPRAPFRSRINNSGPISPDCTAAYGRRPSLSPPKMDAKCPRGPTPLAR